MSKLKTVTKLATDMCKIRDLLEDPEFSFEKMQFKLYFIEDWMNRVIRELDKALRARDISRELDFTPEDLAVIAQEAKDLFNKYSPKYGFKYLMKNITDIVAKHDNNVKKWQQAHSTGLACLAMLNGIYGAMSYAALIALSIQERDYDASIEGQMLAGLKEALKQ